VVDPLVGRLTAQAVDPRGELVITALQSVASERSGSQWMPAGTRCVGRGMIRA
jgi:hypothetical protein